MHFWHLKVKLYLGIHILLIRSLQMCAQKYKENSRYCIEIKCGKTNGIFSEIWRKIFEKYRFLRLHRCRTGADVDEGYIVDLQKIALFSMTSASWNDWICTFIISNHSEQCSMNCSVNMKKQCESYDTSFVAMKRVIVCVVALWP